MAKVHTILHRARHQLFGAASHLVSWLARARGLHPVFVPTSCSGRSLGDVFLALFSSPLLVAKKPGVVFFTHPNHAEITSWFADSLDVVVHSKRAYAFACACRAADIHCMRPSWRDKIPSINNPWRYFILNGVKPRSVEVKRPPAARRVKGPAMILFPERSNNHRIPDALLEPLVASANERGYRSYTNCFINSNYAASKAVPGTEPLLQLTLAEIVELAQDPDIVIVGNRAGIFDLLYFMSLGTGAKLVILYPDHPAFVWEARFQHPEVIANHPAYYWERGNILEFRDADFGPDKHSLVFEQSTPSLSA